MYNDCKYWDPENILKKTCRSDSDTELASFAACQYFSDWSRNMYMSEDGYCSCGARMDRKDDESVFSDRLAIINN